MPRAPLRLVDIAVDKGFEARDAFRATVHASSHSPRLPPPPPPATASRTVWWPLVLIGFLAVACATIAFLKSPVTRHPSVAPYANALVSTIG